MGSCADLMKGRGEHEKQLMFIWTRANPSFPFVRRSRQNSLVRRICSPSQGFARHQLRFTKDLDLAIASASIPLQAKLLVRPAQYILVVSGDNSDACENHRKRTRETGHTDGKIARDLHRELPWPSYIPHPPPEGPPSDEPNVSETIVPLVRVSLDCPDYRYNPWHILCLTCIKASAALLRKGLDI